MKVGELKALLENIDPLLDVYFQNKEYNHWDGIPSPTPIYSVEEREYKDKSHDYIKGTVKFKKMCCIDNKGVGGYR